MKVLVTGASGQLGYDVCRELAKRGYTDVKGVASKDLDITDETAVGQYVRNYRPNVIVHCAAWTAVDKAEDCKDACYKVNVLGTRYIAQAAKKVGAKLVYISTDYVFKGEGNSFQEVDDEKQPLSVYGLTKYQGELEAAKCRKHFIVRVSWVFGVNGNNFVRTMLKLAETKTELNVVNDQVGAPTYTVDLAKLLCDMIVTKKYGTYHATNEGVCSWCDFAKKIFALAGKQVKVNGIPTSAYPTKARRPLNSRLSKSSLDQAGFERLPCWQNALQRYMENELKIAPKKQTKPKVLVIMSTYNGEKYLREQIDSILAQEQVEVHLHVSDDCSKDHTVAIVKEYQTKHKNISLQVNETNKNFTYNFLDALFRYKDNQQYDYYAFADQDDYWQSDKLITAIKKINRTGVCTMYCSNLTLVDENLQSLNKTMMPVNFKLKYWDTVCKNIATGCTIVMDREFKNLATKHYPEKIYLHDYWLAVIANYCQQAHFVYDTNPEHILYRQHGNNQIGKGPGRIVQLLNKTFKRIPEEKSTKNLMTKFYELYNKDIDAETKIIFAKIKDLYAKKSSQYLRKHVNSNFRKRFKIKLLLKNY